MQSQQGRKDNERKREGINNPFGAKGTTKCDACRRKKQKCDYEDPDLPCTYCQKIGTPCGSKNVAPTRQHGHLGVRREYISEPRSPGPIRSSRLPQSRHHASSSIQTQGPWQGRPPRLSQYALKLEEEHPDYNIFQILELANQRINDFQRASESRQNIASRHPSVQQTHSGNANPQELSAGLPMFNTSSNSATNLEHRHSGPSGSSFPNIFTAQLSQPPSSRDSSSNIAIPSSIQDRRPSQPPISPQDQGSFHNPFQAHGHASPSQPNSFNHTSPGNPSIQSYQQSQPQLPVYHHSHSPQNLSLPIEVSAQQQQHDDYQNRGLSLPVVKSRGSSPSSPSQVNPTQTIEDVINSAGTHLISDQAVWRPVWPQETPLQFRHSNATGISGEGSPRPADNAEARATSSTRDGDPMERYFFDSD